MLNKLNNILDFISGFFEPEFGDNWRTSSLDEVIYLLECVKKSQKMPPYIVHKGYIYRKNDFSSSIYVAARTVIDACYKGIDGNKIKFKNANPQEVADFIGRNFFEEKCFVVEKKVGGHPSKDPMILHYDMKESIPTEEYYNYGGRIYIHTGKKMRITRRTEELHRIYPSEFHNFRSLASF